MKGINGRLRSQNTLRRPLWGYLEGIRQNGCSSNNILGPWCVVIALTTGVLTGCGAVNAKPLATNHSQQPIHSSNPFVGLSGGKLLQLSRDLTSLQQATGSTLAAESTWWSNGALPQTAARVAKENIASASMASNEVLIPGAAHSVIGDLSELSIAQQQALQPLKKAAQTLIKVDHTFRINTTTPWAGPGSTPGVTKTVIGTRLQTDTRTIVLANLVVSKDLIQCSSAYSQWLHS